MSESDERKLDEHPSYGMAGFFRSQGGNFNLFGSSIRHNNTISLVISRGKRERALNHDWYYATDALIEVRFSPTQFAELLTTMNVGSGVTCTLELVNGKTMPPCNEINKREEFTEEFRERISDIRRKLQKMEANCDAMLANPKPTKADRELLKSSVASLVQEVNSNLPFVMKCFDEATEKVVSHAKGELDAAFTGAIERLGMKALYEAIGADHIEVPFLKDSPPMIKANPRKESP